MKLTTKIILGLMIGAIVGIILNIAAPNVFKILDPYLFAPLGKIFLNLINMLVVPIVLFSIILGTAGLGDPKMLGRIGLKTIGYFLVTTCIAIIIGIGLAYIIQPGLAGHFDTASAKFSAEKAPSIADTLLNIIPKNPISALAEGNMLQIIAFAIFIGLALTALGDKAKGIYKLVEQGNDIMMYLVTLVMKFAPYGTFGLIASAIGSQGFSAMKAMGIYMIVVVLALIIHALLTYGGAISLLARKNPDLVLQRIPASHGCGILHIQQ